MKRKIHLVIVVFANICFGQVGGYTDKVSYFPGEEVKVFISNDKKTYTFRVFEATDSSHSIFITELSGRIQQVPDSAYWYGCDWKVTTTFIIPEYCKSGVYIGEFLTESGLKRIIFIVKNPNPKKEILFVISTNTYQLYNNFGGKSGYDFNSTNGERSYKMSFNRPYAGLGDGFFTGVPYESNAGWYAPKSKWEYNMSLWLKNNLYNVDYITDTDLDSMENVLDGYKVLTVVGHSEYWSYNMYMKVRNYLYKNAGNFLILSGNTCWIQVRFEDNHRTIVCYKNAAKDPLTGIADSLVTIPWPNPPVKRFVSDIIGPYWSEGGVVNYNFNSTKIFTKEEGYGGYIIMNPNHFIFRGTGLKQLDTLGFNDAIVGYETDGFKLIFWNNGFPLGWSNKYRILGWSPAANWDGSLRGYAAMGIFYISGGGVVFNGATTNWAHGLLNDSQISLITKNILDRMIQKQFPPEIIEFKPLQGIKQCVLHDTITIRPQELIVGVNDTTTLSINAFDFKNRSIKYHFKVNDSIVSSTSKLNLGRFWKQHNTKIRVVGFAICETETSFVKLEIIPKALRFTSYCDTVITVGNPFVYRIQIQSYTDSPTTIYVDNLPTWLQYDPSNHILWGTPNKQDPESSVVKIYATDSIGNTEEQIALIKLRKIIDSVVSPGFPMKYSLFQNYPNPFNSSTKIDISLPRQEFATLVIYDILGRKAVTLLNGDVNAGNHTYEWLADKYPSGVYVYELTTKTFQSRRKMILLK